MFFPPPGGATEYIAYRSLRYMDFARATITRDIFIPGLTQCGLSRSFKTGKTHNIFQLEIHKKKRYILSEKRDGAKKA